VDKIVPDDGDVFKMGSPDFPPSVGKVQSSGRTLEVDLRQDPALAVARDRRLSGI
jgi:hypothetical protein